LWHTCAAPDKMFASITSQMTSITLPDNHVSLLRPQGPLFDLFTLVIKLLDLTVNIMNAAGYVYVVTCEEEKI
jgi:hypothetical protein